MIKPNRKILYIIVALALAALIFYAIQHSGNKRMPANYKEAAFAGLKRIRNNKKEKVIRYLNDQKTAGVKFVKNEHIVSYFKNLYKIYREKKFTSREYRATEALLEELFVYELDKFYDLLFIDNEGNIFFTILKEKDFLGNIFESRFDGLALYENLRKRKDKDVKFIDFEYYSVSHEPASFFISPVEDNGKIIGNVVLQLPVNEVNSILTDRTDLGRTGEVYLVNDKQLMITQSRFLDEDTALNKLIDTEAVRDALKEKTGNKIIKDYRNKMVFSSYERLEYEGTKWIIIAEIDEDEVITDLYARNEDDLFDKISIFTEKYNYAKTDDRTLPRNWKKDKKSIKVDIKEHKKGKDKELLYTLGVTTCTALTICNPGKFGYLAHITPTDIVYTEKSFVKNLIFKDINTDFVGTVLKRIGRYDITQHEKKDLRFGIFATHNLSAKRIIKKLIENGIELSQIKLLCRINYMLVNIVFDYENDTIWNQWRPHIMGNIYTADYNKIPDLGKIVKRVISGE